MTRQSRTKHDFIPVVDLFAGPGGLGEGFASVATNGVQPYRLVLSVECDPVAHQTLELRAFYRAFTWRGLRPPVEYFKHVRDPGEFTRSALFDAHPEKAEEARFEACLATLGESEGDAEVDRRIEALRRSGTDFSRAIVIGGPPCQAYSLVGRSRMAKARSNGEYRESDDGRHVLYRQYLRLLSQLKPAAFVMENVRGILSARYEGRPIFPRILNDLEAAGYSLHALGDAGSTRSERSHSLLQHWPRDDRDPHEYLILADRHGVPQRRARVIVIGTRADLGITAMPMLPQVKRVRTVQDAIGDLPKLRSGLSTNDSPDRWKNAVRRFASRLVRLSGDDNIELAQLLRKIASPRSQIGGQVDRGGGFMATDAVRSESGGLGGVLNHESRGHIPEDLERYLFCAAWARTRGGGSTSPTLRDLPTSILPSHENVVSATKAGTLDEVAFADRFRVQVADEPSTTITSHIAKDGHYYIHYDPRQCRSLTVREAARLQTFPDDYFFCGPRTEQYKQVGNAVPPLLATLIANALASAMID